MKNYYFPIVIFFLLIFEFAEAQNTWVYNKGGNKFDGNYKTASVIGKGGEWPYTKPTFVINTFNDNSINFYISGIGYTGCGKQSLWVAFDNDETIYKTNTITSNIEDDAIFFRYFENLSMLEFIKKLKEHKRFDLRYISSCKKIDLSFTLKGSLKAINYATDKHLNEIKQKNKEEEKALSIIHAKKTDILLKKKSIIKNVNSFFETNERNDKKTDDLFQMEIAKLKSTSSMRLYGKEDMLDLKSSEININERDSVSVLNYLKYKYAYIEFNNKKYFVPDKIFSSLEFGNEVNTILETKDYPLLLPNDVESRIRKGRLSKSIESLRKEPFKSSEIIDCNVSKGTLIDVYPIGKTFYILIGIEGGMRGFIKDNRSNFTYISK